MKLEEAIEIGNCWVSNKPVIPASKLHVAFRLLIQAGKEVERLRPHIHYRVNQLLPGETGK